MKKFDFLCSEPFQGKAIVFKVGDIVTINPEYRESASLDFAQPQIHAHYVMSINDEGTIKLAGVYPDIPTEFVKAVPIDSTLAEQIYYDTVHARPYVPGKVFPQEDVYSRPPFMVAMEKWLRGTYLWGYMQAEEFHYVHELQRWLVAHSCYSRIRINQFWDENALNANG